MLDSPGNGALVMERLLGLLEELFMGGFQKMRRCFLTPQIEAAVFFGTQTLCSLSLAEEGTAEAETAFARSPSANVLGLSLAYQAPSDLDKFGGGVGISFTREYFVTRRTALGINVAPRYFPFEPGHFALGYGLSFKHYVGDWGETKSSGLYVAYGLMMQMNWLKGSSGTATGHDTKMALGFDWTSTTMTPVVEFGYHLTQIRGFDRDTLWWPYTELLVGARF